MIKNKVVLILGAGASAPYGFPLGTKLMTEVINNLQGQSRYNELLYEFGFTPYQQKQFASELRNAMQPSIDSFVQNRKDFLEIGKATIAASLIPYENTPDLMKRDFEMGSRPQNQRWYEYLLNLLGTKDDFTENQLSIITFNYDRSLEFFLFNSLRPRFNINDAEAIKFIKSIPIVHAYGQLGAPSFLDSNGRDYDTNVDSENLMKAIKGISLIYEDRDEAKVTEDLRDAHLLIKDAKLLLFLGFGYHEKNIERLSLREYYKGETIIGTTFGRAPGEVERDIEIIKTFSPSGNNSIPIIVNNGMVLDFLKNTNYLK